MSSNETRKSRLTTSLLALGATTALAAAFAAPAGAASAQGEATIVAASHSKGRTLSAQGVKLVAGPSAGNLGDKLTLPIGEASVATPPSATSPVGLTFKRGKKKVALAGIRFDLQTGTLLGRLGDGNEIPVFKLGGTPEIGTESIVLRDGKLQLTGEAATALKQKLGLARALNKKGVGMIWLDARLIPTSKSSPLPLKDDVAPLPKKPFADPVAVLSGGADWGVLASWRSYIYANMGPGSVGSITLSDGATESGPLNEASSFVSFPATTGLYQKGLEGNADKLVLHTAGAVKFAKPGHCIIEVKFSDLELTIDGANSGIELNSVYDIDTVAGMSCSDDPAVPTADVDFATLDVSGIAPTYSNGGKTITWSQIPAALTAAGSAAWDTTYPAGKALDPVTISVGTE